MALVLAFHKKQSYQNWLNCVLSHVLCSLSLLAVVMFHLFVESSLTTANYDCESVSHANSDWWKDIRTSSKYPAFVFWEVHWFVLRTVRLQCRWMAVIWDTGLYLSTPKAGYLREKKWWGGRKVRILENCSKIFFDFFFTVQAPFLDLNFIGSLTFSPCLTFLPGSLHLLSLTWW